MRKTACLSSGAMLFLGSFLALSPFLALTLFPALFYRVYAVSAYLVFHNVAEFFSIMVSFSIFGAGWYTYDRSRDGQALFLSASFLAIGLLDYMHTLSYAGMPAFITPNNPDKSTQFWIAARFLTSGALLASAYLRRDRPAPWLSKTVLIAPMVGFVTLVFTVILFFPDSLPEMFVEGAGLTTFKVVSEYIIIGIFALAAAAYYRQFRRTGEQLLLAYTAALILSLLCELFFAGYRSVYDTYNALGHVYKVAAFSLIYYGVFASSVSRPYARLIETSEQLSRDIRERTRVEEALRESEERYRLIAENVSDVIWTLDVRSRRFTYVSPSVQRLRGFTPAEVLAQSLDEILTDGSLEAVTRKLEDIIPRVSAGDAGVQEGPIEVEQPCKDGSTVWTEVTTNIVRDSSGMPSAILGVSRNITERKRAEQALMESEQRYRRMVGSVTDYIYAAFIENGEVAGTVFSPGCAAVTGYGPDAFQTDPGLWRSIIHEEDRHRVDERLDRLYRGEPAASVEHRLLHCDGTVRWVKHVAVPRHDKHGRLTAWDGLVSDITERKKLEDQLRQAQKMEAIGQLAGGIAHDFNNILSAIVGYGTLLQMKTEADDPLRANIDPILEAADRAAHLTHSLLAFSRKQVLKSEPVDLNAIVQHVRRLLSRIMGEDIALTTRAWNDRVIVNADRGQIEQVLMNMAANARDAMPRGGSFVMDTRIEDLDDAAIHAKGTGRPGRYAVLTVADTGTGIDEATQKKVFEPFFTTKEQGKGTGLGLSMAYGIVQQHNGFLTLQSEPGKGAQFRIYLPLLEGAVDWQVKAPRAVSPEPAPGGTEMVLVAEDDDALRQLSQTVLHESGYRVIPACDGPDAVVRFREHAANIEIVLLDMIMPGMNGREAYEEIRKIKENVKVLFLSGYTADKENGPDGFPGSIPLLRKPVLPGDLLKKVREVLDS